MAKKKKTYSKARHSAAMKAAWAKHKGKKKLPKATLSQVMKAAWK